ncbi:MAG: hypothetical protein IPO00_03760 [Betaproteobacteria bacterium]|nr:hypothetical protein [Betaproteobacteria bacterium]
MASNAARQTDLAQGFRRHVPQRMRLVFVITVDIDDRIALIDGVNASAQRADDQLLDW